MWNSYKKGFKAWLQLEKSLAANSVEAYLRDIDKLTDYCSQRPVDKPQKKWPTRVTYN